MTRTRHIGSAKLHRAQAQEKLRRKKQESLQAKVKRDTTRTNLVTSEMAAWQREEDVRRRIAERDRKKREGAEAAARMARWEREQEEREAIRRQVIYENAFQPASEIDLIGALMEVRG